MVSGPELELSDDDPELEVPDPELELPLADAELLPEEDSLLVPYPSIGAFPDRFALADAYKLAVCASRCRFAVFRISSSINAITSSSPRFGLSSMALSTVLYLGAIHPSPIHGLFDRNTSVQYCYRPDSSWQTAIIMLYPENRRTLVKKVLRLVVVVSLPADDLRFASFQMVLRVQPEQNLLVVDIARIHDLPEQRLGVLGLQA